MGSEMCIRDRSKKPYEGHYKLKNIKVQRYQEPIQLKKGDWMVNSNQDAALFIHSVLQPELEDAYLSWNFFDSYLQQKEYFSSYVFIDKIEEILNSDLKLKKEYELKTKEDAGFANSCLLYTSPSPRDGLLSRMPSSA